MRTLLPIAALASLAATSAGCGGGEPQEINATIETPDPPPLEDPRDEDVPRFDAPEGWVREAPANDMRLHQFRLPGAEGSADAEVRVASWPGGVGPVEANLVRWAGQMGHSSIPDGSRSDKTVRSFDVAVVDFMGAYTPMGSPDATEGYRMLGAFVERPFPAHAWTIIAVGPEATMGRWKDSFDAFIEGL